MSRAVTNESDSDDDTTALEIEHDDSNIKRNHNLEKRSLLSEDQKKVMKSPSCRVMLCKALIIATAGVLFILMMVELWSDYGTVISTQTLFPPKIHNIFETCGESPSQQSQLTKYYNPMDCTWNYDENTTTTDLTCKGNLPVHPMVQVDGPPHYDNITIATDQLCITWEQRQVTDCTRLLIWSI